MHLIQDDVGVLVKVLHANELLKENSSCDERKPRVLRQAAVQPNLVAHKGPQLPSPFLAHKVSNAGGCNASWLGAQDVAMSPLTGTLVQNVLRNLRGLATPFVHREKRGGRKRANCASVAKIHSPQTNLGTQGPSLLALCHTLVLGVRCWGRGRVLHLNQHLNGYSSHSHFHYLPTWQEGPRGWSVESMLVLILTWVGILTEAEEHQTTVSVINRLLWPCVTLEPIAGMEEDALHHNKAAKA